MKYFYILPALWMILSCDLTESDVQFGLMEHIIEKNENFVEISPLKHAYAVGDKVVIKYSIPKEKINKWLGIHEKTELDVYKIPVYFGPKELKKYTPNFGGDIFEVAYHRELGESGHVYYNAETQKYELEYTLKWLKANELFYWNFLIYGLNGMVYHHIATDSGSRRVPQLFVIKFNIRGEDYENYNKTIRVIAPETN